MQNLKNIFIIALLGIFTFQYADAQTTRRRQEISSGAVTTPSTTPAKPTQSTKQAKSAKTSQPAAPAKPVSKRTLRIQKPDLNEIKAETFNPKSRFYFPKLKEIYERGDTIMNPEEYRYFYLGYMFQEDYDPYRVSPYAKITEELSKKSKHTKSELDTLTVYLKRALDDNPFDLRQMSLLIHTLKERKKYSLAKTWSYRLENLLGAIKSTGTGDSVENAWFVIYPSHEYDLVQLLGYEAVDVKFIDPGYDYLIVQPEGGAKKNNAAKGFYFNVITPQQQYELKYPDEQEE